MKIKFFTLIFAVIFLLFTCAVNQTTGLISITHNGSSNASNIKVGDTVLTYSIASGAKYDYWYYNNILSGKLSAEGIDYFFIADYYDDANGSTHYTEDTACSFKPNYEYKIEIISTAIGSYFSYSLVNILIVNPGYKSGGNAKDSDYIHYPGNN